MALKRPIMCWFAVKKLLTHFQIHFPADSVAAIYHYHTKFLGLLYAMGQHTLSKWYGVKQSSIFI